MVEHIRIIHIHPTVVMVRRVHVLPCVDTVLLPRRLDQVGKKLLRVIRVLDIGYIKIHHGFVSGGAVDGAGTDDLLPQAAAKGDIRDPVKTYLIVRGA